MEFFKKLFSNIKQKNALFSSGFEILKRSNARELDNQTFVSQYGKSLYVTRCISKIAEKVASTELELYKVINSKGEMKELEVHPVLDLLYRPNPFQTKTEFWETTIINLKTTGNAYWLKLRNKGGKVVELWNLRPDLMEITPDSEKYIKNYKFTKADGSQVTLEPEDVVHFKYPDPLSQYFGLSPIRSAGSRIQTEEYATRYQRNFFINSARPDALIKNKTGTLSAIQAEELREGWDAKFKGISNGSKVAILHGDLEYQQISLSQREMDYIETMKFTRDDILAAFAVPKPIVAIVDDVNRANSETAMYIFLSETIKPEISRIVEKINEELVYPDFGDEFIVEFVDPTPENRELKMTEYTQGLASNFYLINEVRQWEGLPPIAGGWSLYIPFSSQAMGGLSQNGKSKDNKGKEIIVKEIETSPRELKPIKVFSFKGKELLKQKLVFKEEVKKILMDAIVKKIIESRKTVKIKQIETPEIKEEEKVEEKKKISYFKEKVIRMAHFTKTNDRIDKNASKLSKDVNEYAEKQKARVLAKLSKKKEIKEKLSAEDLMNVDKEKSIAIALITPYLENFLKESGQDALLTLAPQEDFSLSKQIQRFIKQRAEDFADSQISTTLEKLNRTLAEGIANDESFVDLSKRVSDVYEEFPTYRSDMIARTEATAANAKGAIEGYRQSGVANAKEWINSGDSRVRDEHQDGGGVGGEIVGLDAKFTNGLLEPGEPNCRCVLGPAFIEE